jgi:hypothetical protein
MNEVVVEAVQEALVPRLRFGEMFTAWDVTREVRDRIGLPHRLLKQIVHALFVDGWMGEGYTRTLCDVGGDRGPAWVYHREGDDPACYTTEMLLERLMR